MSESSQSFGEQAARFSLYAPFVALVLGLLTLTKQNQFPVLITIFAVNSVLIVAGFILGVAALLSIRRYGRKRIFGRAVTGVVLNGVIIGLTVSTLVPAMHRARRVHQLSRHWHMTSGVADTDRQIDLTLNPDFTFSMNSSGGNSGRVALSGQWALSRNEIIGIRVGRVAEGDPAAVGREIALGAVRSVDDRQLVLRTDQGEEVYRRVP